jgi:hypothetical protein
MVALQVESERPGNHAVPSTQNATIKPVNLTSEPWGASCSPLTRISAKLPPTCGVILLRLPMPPPGEAGGPLASLILARADWAGHFAVIEPDRIRFRPLKLS